MSNRWMIAMAAGVSVVNIEVPAERDARQPAAQRDARAANQRQDERDRYDARRIGRTPAPC